MTGSIAGAAFFHKKFEVMLPVTCGNIVMLLFLAGILQILKQGVYFILIISAILWIFSFVQLLKTKEWLQFLKNMITPASVVFLALYMILSVLNRDMLVHEWDEFSHWADIVKIMVNTDAFGTAPDSGALFASYPPGMALFQYFLQEIYLMIKPEELFSEWRLYFAYQVFFLSFLVPFLKELSFRKPLKIVMMGMVLWFGPMIIFTNIYSSLYIDPMIGFLAGAGYAMIFVQKEKDWLYHLNIYLFIALLVLMKDAGMLFALFLLVLYVVDLLKDGICKKAIVRAAAAVLALGIPKILWSVNIAVNGVQRAFGNKIDFAELVRIFAGMEPENYRSSVAKMFSLAFLTHKIEFEDIALKLPYMVFMFLFLGISYWIYRQYQRDSSGKAGKIQRITIYLLLIQGIVFVVGTCISYMYKFSQEEALALAGFSRYMRINFHCWIVFLLLSSVYLACKNNFSYRLEILVFCVVMVFVPWTQISMNVTRQTVEHSRAERSSYETLIDQILTASQNGEEASYVTVICQETTGYEQLLFRFALRPHQVDWDYSIGEPFYEGDSYTTEISAKDWQKKLISKDAYVALYRINDYFVNEYAEVFENPDEIGENRLFKINQKTGLLEQVE